MAAQFARTLGRQAAVAVCAAALGSLPGVWAQPVPPSHPRGFASTETQSPALRAPIPSVALRAAGVARFTTAFDGDHSLDAATVAEQAFAQYSLYTVGVQFASGAQQSFAVIAPPGGLQPRMTDMSGDSIPNDLIFTSTLFQMPLVVLLNDGHDHLSLATSPQSVAPVEDQASQHHGPPGSPALLRSGMKPLPVNFLTAGFSAPQAPVFSLPRAHPALLSTVDLCKYTGRAPPLRYTGI